MLIVCVTRPKVTDTLSREFFIGHFVTINIFNFVEEKC